MRFVWALAIVAALAAVCTPAYAGEQPVGQMGPFLDPAPATAGPAISFTVPNSASPNSSNSASPNGTWRGLIWPPMTGGAIGRLGVATGDGLQGASGQPWLIGRFGADNPIGQLAAGGFGGDWQSAVRLKTGAFGFDVTPHAGLGASGSADSQNAGALVRFGRGFGLSDSDPGRRGKWYLFASTDQETLGMGFMRNDDPWKRMGLGPDPGAVIADTRAGVAWRDGPMEASFGYLYREVKPRDLDMQDAQSNHETMVGFRFAFHPGDR